MKTTWIPPLLCALAAAWTIPAGAQEGDEEVVRVPLSDPTRPAGLVVQVLNGGITVRAYDGKDIEVRAAGRDGDEDFDVPAPPSPPAAAQAPAPRASRDDDGNRRDERQRRAAGMRRIPNTSTGLEIVENDNVVHVETASWGHAVDLDIRVPVRTSLTLATVNDGDIVVHGVEGEIEVENTNGEVKVVDVAGSVLAHALNGDIVVSFVRLDPKTSMSFSSLNGDIDVTFPANLKADLRLKADNGEIFTDFDFELRSRKGASKPGASAEDGRGKDKTQKGFRYEYESHGMHATVNGGGPTLHFETFNGNIYIRKRP